MGKITDSAIFQTSLKSFQFWIDVKMYCIFLQKHVLRNCSQSVIHFQRNFFFGIKNIWIYWHVVFSCNLYKVKKPFGMMETVRKACLHYCIAKKQGSSLANNWRNHWPIWIKNWNLVELYTIEIEIQWNLDFIEFRFYW